MAALTSIPKSIRLAFLSVPTTTPLLRHPTTPRTTSPTHLARTSTRPSSSSSSTHPSRVPMEPPRDPRATDVLEFWYGVPLPALSRADFDYGAQSAMWWGGTPELDATMGQRFGHTLAAAERGELREAWAAPPLATVAEIIVLDQMSRNVYRGTEKMFANDAAAHRLARELIVSPDYERLTDPARLFVLVALEHSESIQDHELQRDGFAAIVGRLEREGSPQLKPWSMFESFGKQHYEEVKRFGRFPHRNRLLGRPSTPEEEQYLASSDIGYHKV